ncbi:MAG: hypothetical protein Q9211_004681 [Gyalolechia sp. 1 TL-2023]
MPQENIADGPGEASCGTNEQSRDSDLSENTENAGDEQLEKVGHLINYSQYRGNKLSESDDESEKFERLGMNAQSVVYEHPTESASWEESQDCQSIEQSAEDQSHSSEESEQEKQTGFVDLKKHQAQAQKSRPKAKHSSKCHSQSPPRNIAERLLPGPPNPLQCRKCQHVSESKDQLYRHLIQVHWRPEKYTKRKIDEATDEAGQDKKAKRLRKSDGRHSDGPLLAPEDFQNPMIQQA